LAELRVNYSALDRTVHNLAMAQLETQKLLSRLEDKRFDKTHAEIRAADQVFRPFAGLALTRP